MCVKSNAKGFTLLELLMVVAVLGVITVYAVHAWGEMISQKRTRNSMELVYDGIKLARSESIKRRAVITVSLRSSGGNSWCYAVSDGGDCDCRVENACSFDGANSAVELETTAVFTNFTGPNDGKYVEFEGIRGTVTNSGNIQITDTDFSGTVNVNAMGFINNCSNNVTGYPGC
jgi:prepilin-type N-terminal cleavage/methylation domain-containing protein